MATGYSSISSQLSHGGCVGDEGRLTHSPPGPRTLRRDHDSTQHAVHDASDGVQSATQSAMYRRCEMIHLGEEAGVGVESGLTAVSWRADATLCPIHTADTYASRRQCVHNSQLVLGSNSFDESKQICRRQSLQS